MDIRALMSKLQSIESMTKVMEAGEDPAAVIQKYTDMGKKPTAQMPAFIDPKDGKVKYVDQGNARNGGDPEIKVMPTDWIKRYAPDLADALAAQGGNKKGYGAQEKSGLGAGIFGSDWKGIGSFDRGTKVNVAQAGADSRSAKFITDKLAQLTDLVGKLKTPAAGNTDSSTGKIDYSLTGGTKPKLGAMEGINFSSSIANTIAESFGIALDEADSIKDDLVKQIQAVMAELADTGDSPEVSKALSDAQAAIDAYQKSNTKPADTTGVGRVPGAAHDGQGGTTPSAGGAGDRAKKIARMKELLAKAGAK